MNDVVFVGIKQHIGQKQILQSAWIVLKFILNQNCRLKENGAQRNEHYINKHGINRIMDNNEQVRHIIGNKIFAIETNLVSLEHRLGKCNINPNCYEPLVAIEDILKDLKEILHNGVFKD